MNHTDKAIELLAENCTLQGGIFRSVSASPWFPPLSLLNEFLRSGEDACDQDERMAKWSPFSISEREYFQVKQWWFAKHPGSTEDALEQSNWRDWTVELLERQDASCISVYQCSNLWPAPNWLVKPTPTSSACGYPPCYALRRGLPRALGRVNENPVFTTRAQFISDHRSSLRKAFHSRLPRYNCPTSSRSANRPVSLKP